MYESHLYLTFKDRIGKIENLFCYNCKYYYNVEIKLTKDTYNTYIICPECNKTYLLDGYINLIETIINE